MHTLPRFVLCVPDLDLSFYWALFRAYARPRLDAAGFVCEDRPVRSTTQQETLLASLELGQGEVLALRPLEREQPALLTHVQRLHAAGVRVLLLGNLGGLGAGQFHARVMSDHAAGLACAARALLAQRGPARALLLGSAPHAQVNAQAMREDLPPGALDIQEAAPCVSSLPKLLLAHGRAQAEAALASGALGDGDLVLALDDMLALGAAQAAASHPGQPALAIVGAGATPGGLQALRQGAMQASLFFDPRRWLDAMLAALAAPPGTVHRLEAALIGAQDADRFQSEHALALLEVLDDTVAQMRSARQAAGFYEAVVENMPAMLFVKRMPDLHYFLVNRERERWLGIPRERILGRTAYDFYSREMADLYTERDREVLESGTIVDQPVVPIAVQNGDVRYVLTRKIPLLDANGHPDYLIGISLDVTERELAEQALARRQQELEAAHEALKANQHMLLVSEKMAALGRLTAGIAHEMNTPLAAIRAALAELQALVDEYQASMGDPGVTAEDHGHIAADMRHCAQLAARSAERAASFVHSIKHHTRHQDSNERTWFALAPALEESIVLLDHVLKQHHCRVELSAPDPSLKVHGTPGGLAQIMTNLLTNAVDARLPGRDPVISLRVEAGERSLRLSVQDNGSGIAADNLSRIFDPMFTTKPFGQGTGLGLAIVHHLMAEQFGGRIEVASTPGAGACFTLHFPSPSTLA
jgi:PAS domain S-box-containing protein